jgi:hypothetical protein
VPNSDTTGLDSSKVSEKALGALFASQRRTLSTFVATVSIVMDRVMMDRVLGYSTFL